MGKRKQTMSRIRRLVELGLEGEEVKAVGLWRSASWR
jgi:hypothetical protein